MQNFFGRFSKMLIHAVIGIKISAEKLIQKKHKTVYKNNRCKCTPKNKKKVAYCARCGASLCNREDVYTILLPDLAGDEGDFEGDFWEITNTGWRGLDVVLDNHMTEGGDYFFGFAVGGGNASYGGHAFKEIPHIDALKEKLKNELQPLNLWDEAKFGLYCVM